MKAIGANVSGVQGDVAQLADLDRLYATVSKAKRRIDIIFANAGVGEFVTSDWRILNGQKQSEKVRELLVPKERVRAVMVSKEKLETEFLALLHQLQPDRDAITAFPKIAAKVWAPRQADADASTKRLLMRLQDAKELKAELLRAKLRAEVSQPDYEEANGQYTEEIAALGERLQLIQSSKERLERFVGFAELMLVDIGGAWRKAGAEQRVRVQNLLFGEGLLYSKQLGFLNTSKPSLFTVLEEISTEKVLLASPTGFEPVLPP